jgi:release factor glutamine methyltransferase
MLPWEKELFQFWKDQELSLAHHYPGLHFERLKQLVQDIYWDRFHSDPIPLNEIFKQLSSGIPLEYITKEKYFYKAPFYVSKAVLIPRSETEILVERAVAFLKKNPMKNFIADIGTGSGTILLSILMEIDRPLKSIGSDISISALQVARKNYDRHRYQMNPKTQFDFYYADRLTGFCEKFDLIVSNPPYIKRQADFNKVHHQAHAYEPHLALYLEDGRYYSWFKKLFEQIQQSLKPGGLALVEGHEDHLVSLQILAKEIGFAKVEIIKDYNQQDRFLELQS